MQRLQVEQRQKITMVLLEQWESHLNQNPAYFNIEYAYFPVIPEQNLLPILSDAQKQTWERAQKVVLAANPNPTGAAEQGPLDDEFPDEVMRESAGIQQINGNRKRHATVAKSRHHRTVRENSIP